MINLSQEIFVGYFHNGLKVKHFIKFHAHKPMDSVEEIMERVECYMKKKENNVGKRVRDARD